MTYSYDNSLGNGDYMSKQITVHYEGNPIYDITIEKDYSKLASVIKEQVASEHRICIVSDSSVASFYLEAVVNIAKECVNKVTSFVFPAGEQSKTLDVVEDLYEHLIKEKFDRKDILLALGGGVVGDLTGFASATYLRGIKVIQVPTTLLAMVDSSIGGKTGVDFRGYKNMVGAFHQPSAVYMNLSTLNTLTEKQYFSGFGEIIKHGLIKDTKYYSYIEQHLLELNERNLDILEEVVAESCNIKRLVVENDPTEKGERALLNFGHTLGHAIEKLMNFTLLHGECVSLGMVTAGYISMKRGMISKNDYDQMVRMLETLRLPTSVSGIDINKIIETSKNDKKMDAGKIKFILLDKPGNAVIKKDVTDDEMKEALSIIIN